MYHSIFDIVICAITTAHVFGFRMVYVLHKKGVVDCAKQLGISYAAAEKKMFA